VSTNSGAKWTEVGALTTAGTVAATIFCCLALLAYSFYQAYRPAPACAADSCDVASSVRRRRIVLPVVTVAVVALLTASWWANWLIYWTL